VGVWDAFYMTIVTVTTVGYREVHQLSWSGEAWTVGVLVLSANLRQQFGVIVVGVQRKDGRMEFNPESDRLRGAGDKLVVLGRPDSLKTLDAHASVGKA
jgi:K+/H+ antiporter YhaU regulatory subunit KhtT